MRQSPTILICAALCLTAGAVCQESGRRASRQIGRESRAVRNDSDLTTRVRGPALGFSYNKQGGLQPILGIPGTAQLGPAIMGIGALEEAAVSSSRALAVGVAGEQRQFALVRNLDGAVTASAPRHVPPGVDRFVLSPSGSAALLYYRAERRVLALAGLPGEPTVAWSRTLAGLRGSLRAMAVSDDGRVALASVVDGDQSFLLRISSAEGWRHLGPLEGETALAFAVRGHDAAFVEKSSNRLTLVREALSSAEMVLLAEGHSGLSRPVAIAFSADASRVVVANAAPASITEVRVADRLVTSAPSRWVPQSLERLAGNAVFLLGRPPGGPLLLYDGDSPRRRIALVAGPRPDSVAETPGGGQ